MEEKKNDNCFDSDLKVLDTVSLAQIISVLETEDEKERKKFLKDLKKTFAKRVELFQEKEKYEEEEQKRLESLLDVFNIPAFNPPSEEKNYKWKGEKMSAPEIVYNLSILSDYTQHMFELLILYFEEDNNVDKKFSLHCMKRFMEKKIQGLSTELYNKIDCADKNK